MRTIAAIGHGPGGLGGAWRPMAWMPAIETIRARLAALAAEGPLRVHTTLDAGFPLMVAAAALLARDEGAPITLVAVLPHPLPAEEDREPRAIYSWARRALARADERHVLFPREPRHRLEAQAATQETARQLFGDADLVLACWNGRRGNRTWSALQRTGGLPVENLWPEIAQGLRLPAHGLVGGAEGVG